MVKFKRSWIIPIGISIFIIAIAFFLAIKVPSNETDKLSELPFKVDQLLIKVLIKEKESFSSPVNIMDISDEEIVVGLEPKYLLDIASVSDTSFSLKPGQTKTVNIDFKSYLEEQDISQSPGAYIGALEVISGENRQIIPMIVEIETKDVLFDSNLDINAKGKEVQRGEYASIQVNLFNLKRMGMTNVKMDYFVKDIMGNIIMTESESVVVDTRATFTKTIEIPKNFNPGDYVFVAQAGYADSIGTSTLLFKVPGDEEQTGGLLKDYCEENDCWTGGIILIIAILMFIIIGYFFFGAFLLEKAKGITKRKELEADIKNEIEADIKEDIERGLLKTIPHFKSKTKRISIREKKKVFRREKVTKKPIRCASRKDIEKRQLKEKINGWKAKGYDTTVLEEKLKGRKIDSSIKDNLKNQIKEWKAKGYDTKILEEKLRNL